MTTARLEAFSDGVIAILITIMVLELPKPAAGTTVAAALHDGVPQILWYLLSFVFLGIYWNNHHHMFSVVDHVNGAVLWANLHLLFWLSLIPFATGLFSLDALAPLATLLYGVVLFASAIAYTILVQTILHFEGRNSTLGQAIGSDRKGWISLAFYAAGITVAMYSPSIADGFYVLVALIWIVPDRRIERRVGHPSHE